MDVQEMANVRLPTSEPEPAAGTKRREVRKGVERVVARATGIVAAGSHVVAILYAAFLQRTKWRQNAARSVKTL